MIALFVQVGAACQTEAYIKGETRDCFAGRQIRPPGIDIFLIDPAKYPSISKILERMDRQSAQGDRGLRSFWDSYSQLVHEMKKAKALARVVAAKDGTFAFDQLHVGQKVIILGLAEREDDPAYYALERLTLRQGVNSVTLDFYGGHSCGAG